jgi:hypothetical protein
VILHPIVYTAMLPIFYSTATAANLARLAIFFTLTFLPAVRSIPNRPRQSSEPVSLVYQFPAGTFIENVAVRPNDNILAIANTSPLLYEIDPDAGPGVTVAYDFSVAGNALQSIVELYEDIFYIQVVSCSILKNVTCSEGSGRIWGIDFNHQPPKAHQVAQIPEAKFLNGVAVLNQDKGLIIFSDNTAGQFWTLNVYTAAYNLSIPDPLMNGNGSRGINGVRVRNTDIWFVNSDTGTLQRLPVDTSNGVATGSVVTVAMGLKPDDFELERRPHPKRAYVTNGIIAELVEVDLTNGNITRVFTGGPSFSGLTSARWGRAEGYGKGRGRGDFLYVSTDGGLQQYFDGNVTNGGGVIRVDLR